MSLLIALVNGVLTLCCFHLYHASKCIPLCLIVVILVLRSYHSSHTGGLTPVMQVEQLQLGYWVACYMHPMSLLPVLCRCMSIFYMQFSRYIPRYVKSWMLTLISSVIVSGLFSYQSIMTRHSVRVGLYLIGSPPSTGCTNRDLHVCLRTYADHSGYFIFFKKWRAALVFL